MLLCIKSQLGKYRMTERCLLIFRWLCFLKNTYHHTGVCVRVNKSAMSHLLLYRFQFQRSFCICRSILSLILLRILIIIYSSLLFIFPRDFVLPCIVSTVLSVHGSCAAGSHMMIMEVLLLC